MLLFIRIFLVLYGLIAIASGFKGMTVPYDSATAPFADNSHRFVATIWASTSLAFFYVAWHPSEVALFRFLMIALFIGGIVRAIALVHYPPSRLITAGILLEIIPTAIMWWMHTKLLNEGII